MSNEQITGQMSIFDFIEQEPKVKAPILLKPKQIVYKVVRGDIEIFQCTDDTWTYHDDDSGRGYRLEGVACARTFDTAFNDQIGSLVFTDLGAAQRQAAINLKNCNVILASEMVPERVVAYSHIWNDREIIYYYAILQNGMLYRSSDGLYDHIPKDHSRAIEDFEMKKDLRINRDKLEVKELEGYMPDFQNMYEVKKDNWLYACARYNFCYV